MLSDGMISPRNGLLGNGMESNRSLKNKAVVTTEKKVNKEADDKIRQLKKKQHNYIENQLQDIRRMVNTPVFIGSYYGTKVGQSFAKVSHQLL
jgi:ribosomal protein S19